MHWSVANVSMKLIGTKRVSRMSMQILKVDSAFGVEGLLGRPEEVAETHCPHDKRNVLFGELYLEALFQMESHQV